jgi:hypothetical protein
MRIVIREEQYKILLEENFKSNIIKKLESLKNFTFDVVNDLKNSFNFNIKFGLTYGAGIGVVLSHITDFLHNRYTSLSEDEIKMLAIAAIMVVFFETKDVLKLEEKIESEGLSNEFADATTFADKLKTRFSKIIKSLGTSIWRGSDIIGYAFLLPILGELTKFLHTYDVTDIDFESIAKSISIATGIIVSGHILKKMFDNVSKS